MLFFEKLTLLLRKQYALVAYLIVGCLTAALYFSLFALLWQFLGINYRLAISMTYVASVLFHFSVNRRFTFKAHGQHLGQQMLRYGCMVAINYVVTLTVMYLVVEIAAWTPYLGVLLAIAVNVSSNFMLSRFWVFRLS